VALRATGSSLDLPVYFSRTRKHRNVLSVPVLARIFEQLFACGQDGRLAGSVYGLARWGAVARTGRKKREQPVVLVAEDEPTVLALAASNIEEIGYATLSAANTREALALLDEDARVDLLFTDITMPEAADGFELARRAVELRPGLRVIYTSGGGLTDGMRALFVEGAAFLPKPYTRDQLIEAILGGKPPPTGNDSKP